jgi:hypothetical protein
MNPDCLRAIRDQCKAAGIPFFMKQLANFAKAETLVQTLDRVRHQINIFTTS